MIILKSITETLRLVLTYNAQIDYSISYVDITASSFSPLTNEGKVITGSTVTILDHPSASTQRQVKLITISNIDPSVTGIVKIEKYDTGSLTSWALSPSVTLLAGETLQYMDGQGWVYYSATGMIKTNQAAAGADTQIQFNSNGVLAGDSGLTWNSATHDLTLSGTDVNIVATGITNEPATPAAGTAVLYTKAVVGKMQLKIKGPSGMDTPLQAAFWQNNTVWWTPGAAAGVYTGTAGANLGTAAAVTPTTTNLYTIMRKSTFASIVTTANQQVGIRTENMFAIGGGTGYGGFLFVCRFGFTKWVAGDRLFVGLCATTTTVTTVQPSTLTNILGFGIDAGDTAITFLHNDTTGTCTKDTIAGQPGLLTNNGYDAYIWVAPNDTTVHYRLDNILTGATLVDATATTDLPITNTLLTAQCIMGNAANVVVGDATIGVNRMYIETDR